LSAYAGKPINFWSDDNRWQVVDVFSDENPDRELISIVLSTSHW
jgi:hypothetical protein